MARLPQILDREALPEDKRFVHDYLVGTRGRVSAAFGSLLHKPELTYRIAHLGTYIRFESGLPNSVRELTALTTSTELSNAYEQAIHIREALAQGARQTTIDAVVRWEDVVDATPEEAAAINCARELARSHHLSDEAFAEALKLFGEGGVVELMATISYYSFLANLHNALEIA